MRHSLLRVVTFNVRNGRAADGANAWPRRRHLAARVLADLAPDVVGLQEAYPDQIEDLLSALPGFAWVGGGRADGRDRGEHVPILYDTTRFDLVRTATVWFGARPHVPGTRLPGAIHPRIATFARLLHRDAVPAGPADELEVVNLHLDHAVQRNRAASVRQLVGWLGEPLPRIVLGDFNARPENPALDPLRAAGYRSALPPDAGGTVHGFEGGDAGPQIDHVFVSSHVAVRSWSVVRISEAGIYPSDHWPVAVELELMREDEAVEEGTRGRPRG